MKKSTCTLLKTTATLSTLTVMGLHLSTVLISPPRVYGSVVSPSSMFLRTYFSYLAQSSDIIGQGEVVRSVDDEYDVRIIHAMVGCTNGQLFTFWQDVDDLESEPPLQAQIVFAVATNEYHFPLGDLHNFYNDIRDGIPRTTQKNPRLVGYPRSWFYVDADNGEQYLYFTNTLQNIRIQKNWTNYYEICRSGILSQSPRIKEDFCFSMDLLIDDSRRTHLQYFLNDPLLDVRVKNYINALEAHYEAFVLNPNYNGTPPFFSHFVRIESQWRSE